MGSETFLLLARSVGGLCMCIVGISLAVRMLGLARRTRQLPELVIGLHMVAIVLGYVLEFAAMHIAPTDPASAVWLRAMANLMYAASIGAYLVFTWKVFAPESSRARAFVAILTAALAVGWTGEALTTDFGIDAERFAKPWFWIAFVPRMLGMGWASSAAFVHHAKLRRQVVLGLADPGVTHRLLLWGLAALGESLIYAVVAFTILAGQPAGYLTGHAALWVSAFGTGAAACIWLGFFPPARYQRWVEGRSGLQVQSSREG